MSFLSFPLALCFDHRLYCIVWWFVQDATKILAYRWLKAYNIFGINETGRLLKAKHFPPFLRLFTMQIV